jgi:hypothetical protein
MAFILGMQFFLNKTTEKPNVLLPKIKTNIRRGTNQKK